jgi:ABC-2 type transport system permease protein
MRWFHKYVRVFELGFQTALEYRLNFLLSLVSAVFPIFIQTFLWTAIFTASSAGSSAVIYGYTYQQMIAYTFLAGLVARIVRTGFEYEIMDDVKSGKFSKFLVQPVGYFPYRIASYFGQKLPNLVMVLVILALVLVGLVLFMGMTLEFIRILVFLVTIVLAVTLNFLIFYCISAMSFWIVEVGFLFEGIRITTILLSGGIFPLEVFGDTFNRINNFLPFRYTISYPINVLNGRLAPGEIVTGMLVQVLWIGLCVLLADGLWRVGSRRFVAVGG